MKKRITQVAVKSHEDMVAVAATEFAVHALDEAHEGQHNINLEIGSILADVIDKIWNNLLIHAGHSNENRDEADIGLIVAGIMVGLAKGNPVTTFNLSGQVNVMTSAMLNKFADELLKSAGTPPDPAILEQWQENYSVKAGNRRAEALDAISTIIDPNFQP